MKIEGDERPAEYTHETQTPSRMYAHSLLIRETQLSPVSATFPYDERFRALLLWWSSPTCGLGTPSLWHVASKSSTRKWSYFCLAKTRGMSLRNIICETETKFLRLADARPCSGSMPRVPIQTQTLTGCAYRLDQCMRSTRTRRPMLVTCHAGSCSATS